MDKRREGRGSVKLSAQEGGVADFGIGVYRRFNIGSVALVLDRLTVSI